MDEETKREIILEHNAHPFNRKTVTDEGFIKVNSNNSSCIDNINLYVKFDKDKLVDFYFDGEACAISTSATSIMIKSLLNKSLDEINTFIANYEKMLAGKEYNNGLLEEANVYSEIYKQQNRKKCALLPYEGLKEAIKKYLEN